MIISLVSTKGGTGKTTSAIYLAMSMQRYGRSVEVIDLDPQGSAAQWASLATTDERLPFPVTVADAATLQRTLSWSKAEIILIDTPPGHPDRIQTAIDASDLVIVTTRPNPADIQQAWSLSAALAGKKWGILLTQARVGTRTLTAATEAITEAEPPITFPHPIFMRESIAADYGYIPSDLHSYPIVADHILRLA